MSASRHKPIIFFRPSLYTSWGRASDYNKGYIMHDYPFEKNEYNYMAAYLIFGPRSNTIKLFNQYSFEQFREEKDIKLTEYTGMNTQNRIDTSRTLRIDKNRSLKTDHTRLTTNINQAVTYHDAIFNINMSDAIFSDDEFSNYKDWDEYCKNKVKNFALLIRTILKKEMADVPLFINEYPNIMRLLLCYPEYWLDKENLEEIKEKIG